MICVARARASALTIVGLTLVDQLGELEQEGRPAGLTVGLLASLSGLPQPQQAVDLALDLERQRVVAVQAGLGVLAC